MRRGDAERDERSVLREARSTRDRRYECGAIADQVIGREHQQDDIAAVPLLRPERGECNRGRGIAAERLEKVRGARRQPVAQAGVGILRVEVVLAVGDGHEVRQAGNGERPRGGLGEQRLAIRQRHRRLGRGLPRQRPQSRTSTAGKNHWNDADRRLGVGHRGVDR
jgi:hypothetical protein